MSQIESESKEITSKTPVCAEGGDENKGIKRPFDESKSKDTKEETVHSANDWEHAELGDSGRKQKFLRLMGASKKEHSGRFVIGDVEQKHTKAGEKADEIDKNLEEQFIVGLENKLSGASRHHKGLGYDAEEAAETTEKSEDQGEEDAEEDASEESEEKKESNSDADEQTEVDTSKDDKSNGAEKIIGFVKASS